MTTNEIEIGIEDINQWNGLILNWYKCPSCNDNNIAEDFNYCPNCGKKIVWKKEITPLKEPD